STPYRAPLPSAPRQRIDSVGQQRTPGRRTCWRAAHRVQSMSSQSGRRFLVLGGIRSGKSALAEQLVSGFTGVRYIATAYIATVADGDDPEWGVRIAAHRERRPSSWSTEEVGTDPAHLITLLTEAKPDDTVLVDDLGGWLTATLEAARVPAATSPAGASVDD